MGSHLVPRVGGLKTDNWVLFSKSQRAPLGSVHWFGRWRQYVFEPCDGSVFNAGCLESVRAFLAEAMTEWNAGRKK
jgi:hypothetical protein